jgi:hypothetical protein
VYLVSLKLVKELETDAKKNARFWFLAVVTVIIIVFWDITRCCLVETYRG